LYSIGHHESSKIVCHWTPMIYSRPPLGPNIRPFLPTSRVELPPPSPNVHPSRLTCDNCPCSPQAWQAKLTRRACPQRMVAADAKSFVRNILPISSLKSKILRDFPRNLLIPQDQGEGRGYPRDRAASYSERTGDRERTGNWELVTGNWELRTNGTFPRCRLYFNPSSRLARKRRSGSCRAKASAFSYEARASGIRPNLRHRSARAECAR
jgi:hypothetical protein